MRYKLTDRNLFTGEVTTSYYDTDQDAKVCACGCHASLPKGRSDKKYLNEAHRKRHARAKTAPKDRSCPCGCGKIVSGPKKRFFSPSCRVRHLRAIRAAEAEAAIA